MKFTKVKDRCWVLSYKDKTFIGESKKDCLEQFEVFWKENSK